MPRAFRILRLALREALLANDLVRTPEPAAEMSSRESIVGFHNEGAASLLPVYHFNALAVDSLAPPGGRILDLGCGSGQFLAHLAVRRPDLRITGLDLAEEMIGLGQEMLARRSLTHRVRLLRGDMRHLEQVEREKIDVISTVFSLHHLPTHDDLIACIREMRRIIAAHQARLWLFDFARPRTQTTAREFAGIFAPNASRAHLEDTRNSLHASWSFDELRSALQSDFQGQMHSCRARLIPLYQIHWFEGPRRPGRSSEWLEADDLPRTARFDAKLLSRLFASTPLTRGEPVDDRPLPRTLAQ